MEHNARTSKQTLHLLHALLLRPDEWRYGYDLSRETSLRFGTLYPQLTRLEASGFLEAQWQQARRGKPRHLYRLTEAGTRHAQELLDKAAAAALLPAANGT